LINAFGLVLGKYKGLRTVDHAGGDAGYRSDMTALPGPALFCCGSLQLRGQPVQLAWSARSRIIYLAQDMKESEPSTGAATATPSAGINLTEQQLAGLAGLYWDPDGDQFRNAYLKDGKLHVSLGREDDFVLKPVSGTLFHLAEVPFGDQVNLHFEPGAGDKAPPYSGERLATGNPVCLSPSRLSRRAWAERAEYAGNYG